MPTEISQKYILALDQGTTSSRAIILNHDGAVVASSQKPFEQLFPRPGWVEHDPGEIWYTQSSVAAEVVAKADLTGLDIACIGITNQRETTIVWDRDTSLPIYNAIVWQDRRTADYCEQLKREGRAEMIREKTGLILDAYFSATKVKWILDNVEGARERAGKGKLCFGTVDSWLVWKFTRGRAHVTDVSNASRTMLFNIHTLEWDKELLELFDIPESMLPEVRNSSEVYCDTASTLFSTKIPISGIAGDQQAALLGQLCTEPGMVKTTYGTGCFMMTNTGDKAVVSKNNLLTTIAWRIGDRVTYALEGSVFVGGAVVQWLRDAVHVVTSSAETEELAMSVPDNGGVYFVPALTGLGAPYWDQYARGTIVGITRGTTAAYLARAALEGIAYEVYDIMGAMASDVGTLAQEMRVDGGAVANNFLMQFQADICRGDVLRPEILESTAVGAAYLAGLAVGYWENIGELQKIWKLDRAFGPVIPVEQADKLLRDWHRAVKRAEGWAKEE
ncbi:MAG: glycerol kinase GlpK [Rikenellaceae bacterium]|nr:glycerol kinase GlpK [Rikenellaceae bacterium]